MKPSHLLFSALLLASTTLAATASADSAAEANASEAVTRLQTGWAEAKYAMTAPDKQLSALTALESEAADAAAKNPQAAGPLIWQAIILSTDAGISGGVSALGKVKEAKALLEKAEALDATALDGSVYTSLGSLYYQVPGWPLGFGDDKKAAEYLTKALAANPGGIDPNYFYGDFLLKKGKYKEAITALEKALQAPPRPNRESADAGRRQEIQVALEKARKKSGVKTGS